MSGALASAGLRHLMGLWILGTAAVVVAQPPSSPQDGDPARSGGRICATLPSPQASIRFRKMRLDLRRIDDLRRLAAAIERELHPADTMTEAGASGRALAEMRSLISRALAAERPCEALAEIAEIGDALALGATLPVRSRLDVLHAPFYYLRLLHNPVARGTQRAANLSQDAATSADSSLTDPLPSSFWSRPKDVASRDLYHLFGPILTTGNEPCLYDEPKTSYGTTPGFSMKCGENVIKVKFGAVKFGSPDNSKRDTEVVVARLFGALGFHVEPSDEAPEIRVRYDRRILLEFNSRKDLTLTLTVLGFIPVYRLKVQSVEDPFHYIRSAVLKSGEVLSPEALARKLIREDVLSRSSRRAGKEPSGTLPGHYREDAAAFEDTVDYLILREANVQARESGGRNIGPWGWDRLDHSRARELRGAALLSAWVNYFDARWDNDRLKFADGDGKAGAAGSVEHFFSDLGSGLGRAESFRVAEGNMVNDFPWTFTEGPRRQPKSERRPFRIVGYKPIFPNGAFREMTRDDARWMARLIAQLTENQIKQALIAGGFASAEVKLYTEKLISRRDTMIEDLGLGGEIAPLRPNGVNRSFDYDPRKDGPVLATTADGSILRPLESEDLVVRAGRVGPR